MVQSVRPFCRECLSNALPIKAAVAANKPIGARAPAGPSLVATPLPADRLPGAPVILTGLTPRMNRRRLSAGRRQTLEQAGTAP